MDLFRNPRWIKQFEYPYQRYEDIPDSLFDSINNGLDRIQSETPVVSIVVTAWNEEVDILRTIGSLSYTQTDIPLEIIVVNNNSTDRTQDTLNRLHIRSCFQPIQGWGPGRQLGQENARGKYILLADSDCIYPPNWVNRMMEALTTKGVVSVYGRYSFISEPGYSRWQLSILETGKDIIAEIRHVKRPYLNSYGMSMGYIKELGLKEGFYMNKTHGEDGRMCFDLMKYGSVEQVRARDARVWTGVRTLKKSGSFAKVLSTRFLKEIGRFTEYFNTRVKHHHPKH